ncbi:hypothetical protein OG474_42275 [Kribbella sp. NBC_01505]|uniref:hypothetical protein n=1 Tax=Kribbella sp. NBC_01505 TaxID=2903580 RepID=UPI00386A6AF8
MSTWRTSAGEELRESGPFTPAKAQYVVRQAAAGLAPFLADEPAELDHQRYQGREEDQTKQAQSEEAEEAQALKARADYR